MQVQQGSYVLSMVIQPPHTKSASYIWYEFCKGNNHRKHMGPMGVKWVMPGENSLVFLKQEHTISDLNSEGKSYGSESVCCGLKGKWRWVMSNEGLKTKSLRLSQLYHLSLLIKFSIKKQRTSQWFILNTRQGCVESISTLQIPLVGIFLTFAFFSILNQ